MKEFNDYGEALRALRTIPPHLRTMIHKMDGSSIQQIQRIVPTVAMVRVKKAGPWALGWRLKVGTKRKEYKTTMCFGSEDIFNVVVPHLADAELVLPDISVRASLCSLLWPKKRKDIRRRIDAYAHDQFVTKLYPNSEIVVISPQLPHWHKNVFRIPKGKRNLLLPYIAEVLAAAEELNPNVEIRISFCQDRGQEAENLGEGES